MPKGEPMKTLIYLEDALNIAMQYCPDDDGSYSKSGVDIREMLDELESLPSVQLEPYEDAVSRKMVSEWLKQYGQDVLHGKYKFSLMYIWKNLMDLPYVQTERKTGQWIEYIPEHGKCPFCGNQVDLLGGKENNFCSECGAAMRGTERKE